MGGRIQQHGLFPLALMRRSLWIFALARTNPYRLKSALISPQKSFLGGRICFDIAADTVKIGSFTTWLNRRFMATLHNR